VNRHYPVKTLNDLQTTDFSWQQGDIAFFPLCLPPYFFAMYWFTAKSEKIKNRFYKYDMGERFVMGVLPGIIALIFFWLFPFGPGFGLSETLLYTLAWTSHLSAYINLVNYTDRIVVALGWGKFCSGDCCFRLQSSFWLPLP
jgi:hypothetical protein